MAISKLQNLHVSPLKWPLWMLTFNLKKGPLCSQQFFGKFPVVDYMGEIILTSFEVLQFLENGNWNFQISRRTIIVSPIVWLFSILLSGIKKKSFE